ASAQSDGFGSGRPVYRARLHPAQSARRTRPRGAQALPRHDSGADAGGGPRRETRLRGWRPRDRPLPRAPLARRQGLGGDRHLPGRERPDRRALGRAPGRGRRRAQSEFAFLGGAMRFKDKVVLVLGGNSGIGLAAAKAFAAEGARVHFTGRSWRTIEAAQQAIPGSTGYQSDIADPAATEDLIARVEAADDRI